MQLGVALEAWAGDRLIGIGERRVICAIDSSFISLEALGKACEQQVDVQQTPSK